MKLRDAPERGETMKTEDARWQTTFLELENAVRYVSGSEPTPAPCNSTGVYADVELWLDRELFESLAEGRNAPQTQPSAAALSGNSTPCRQTQLRSVRPYPLLDAFVSAGINHEPDGTLMHGSTSRHAGDQHVQSRNVAEGQLRPAMPEPSHPVHKRRRTAVVFQSRHEISQYLEAALDELEREAEDGVTADAEATGGNASSDVAADASHLVSPRKVGRGAVAGTREHKTLSSTRTRPESIEQALLRIYAELRQRVLAQKYETIEAFIADFSLLLSDIARSSKPEHTTSRVATRRRTDLIRQRVDSLLQPAEMSRIMATSSSDRPASSEEPAILPAQPDKISQGPLLPYWYWLREQLSLDFASRDALGPWSLALDAVAADPEHVIHPECTASAQVPDLRGAVRPPLASVEGYTGSLAVQTATKDVITIPKKYGHWLHRIYRLREQKEDLQQRMNRFYQLEAMLHVAERDKAIGEQPNARCAEFVRSTLESSHVSEKNAVRSQQLEASQGAANPGNASQEKPALQLHALRAADSEARPQTKAMSTSPNASVRLPRLAAAWSMPLFIETDREPDEPMRSTAGLLGVPAASVTESVPTEAAPRLDQRPRGLVQVSLPLPLQGLQRAVAAVLVLSGFTGAHRSALESLTDVVAEFIEGLGRQFSWIRYQMKRPPADQQSSSAASAESGAKAARVRERVDKVSRAWWQAPRDYLHQSRCALPGAAVADPLHYFVSIISQSGIQDGFHGLMRYSQLELPALERGLAQAEALLSTKIAETERALEHLAQRIPAFDAPAGHLEVEKKTFLPPALQDGNATIRSDEELDPESNPLFRYFGIINESVTLDVLQLEYQRTDAVAVPYPLAQRVVTELEKTPVQPVSAGHPARRITVVRAASRRQLRPHEAVS
jgi:hypothetical protein